MYATILRKYRASWNLIIGCSPLYSVYVSCWLDILPNNQLEGTLNQQLLRAMNKRVWENFIHASLLMFRLCVSATLSYPTNYNDG